MSGIEGKNIEQLFKEAADNFAPSYNPNAWTQMQAKIAAQNSPVGFWSVPKIIIAIVVLILSLGFLFYFTANDRTKELKNNQIFNLDSNKSKNGASLAFDLNDSLCIDDSVEIVIFELDSSCLEDISVLPKINSRILKEKASNILTKKGDPKLSKIDKGQSQKFIQPKQEEKVNLDVKVNSEVITSEKVTEQVESLPDDAGVINQEVFILDNLQLKLLEEEIFELSNLSMDSFVSDSILVEEEIEDDDFKRFSISLMLAPDFSGAKPTKMKGTGVNLGLMLEYFFQRNLSINMGAQYASKKYFIDEGFEGYASRWPARVQPDEIDASCTVIDIPINLKYYFYKNPKIRMFINGGITSYIMLTEDYLYKYADGNTNDWAVKIENENKHVFGVVNFSVGLQKSIGKGFYIIGEPFYKIPIQGIGAGSVNLHSSGLYISIKKDF